MKTVNEYMTLSYKMKITPDKDEGGFVVSFPELPGCLSIGKTVEEAVKNAEDARKEWLTAAFEEGIEINKPQI